MGDTVNMRNGKFVFEGRLESPVSVTVKVCPDSDQPASLGFIAENSPIRVMAAWKDVIERYGYRSIGGQTVEGSLNQEVYEKIAGVYGQILKAPEHKEYAEAQQKMAGLRNTDTEAYYKLQDETEPLSERFSEAVRQRQLELIRENRTVESSVLNLRMMWNDMTLEELKEVFSVLDPKVQNSPMAAEVREEIAIRERVRPGQPAPDFSLETPDGSRLALSDLRGKYVLLDFWASWCRPCRASFPEMKKIYARFKDKGFEILGVTNDSRREDWLKALEQDQLPWKQVIDAQRHAAFFAQVPQDGLRFGAGGIFPQCPDAAVGIAEDVVIHLELHHARRDAVQIGADERLLRGESFLTKRILHGHSSISAVSQRAPSMRSNTSWVASCSK